MTWLDWIVLVLLLSFTIRGILRGTVAQVFAFFGLVAGIFAGAWILHHVGELWRDARPAVVFGLLRTLVALLGGLAIAAFFGWWGESVAKAVHDGPLGWADRLAGGVIGLLVAGALASLVALAVVQASGWSALRGAASHSVSVSPLLAVGARATAWSGAPVPGAGWLHRQYLTAEHRLTLLRSS